MPSPDQSAAQSQPAAGEQAANPEAVFMQQVSYCIGLQIGGNLKKDGIPVDPQGLLQGITDSLRGVEPQLTEEQQAAVMGRFQQLMQLKAQETAGPMASDNQTKGEAFLAENKQKPGVQVTESGLQYRVVEQGTGPSPSATDTVRCHYEGTLIGGEVFDSSYKRGQPATFPVNRVIAGWTEALQMMKVGGKWEVFLPSEIAYGESGAPGAIGPNETLIFTIELLGIE
ncbi:FKBP-type peptidyl-prolyl cis-trans isomerase [Pseudobythopirellula maris]|nr:FKBP-type peptidyl-prolyl cis-trans isomerase [Pseudobythopirellula maris]